MKSRSREIGRLNYRIAMKFDRHISSSAAEVPVKFQSDRTILNTSYPILKRGPGRYTIQSSPKLDVK